MHPGTSSRMKKDETKACILLKSEPGNFYFYFIYQNNVTWTSIMKIGLKRAVHPILFLSSLKMESRKKKVSVMCVNQIKLETPS